jgi:hypothetical protein
MHELRYIWEKTHPISSIVFVVSGIHRDGKLEFIPYG